MHAGYAQLLTLGSAALLLCALPAPAQARIRMGDYVEYEEHELPENETFSEEQEEWVNLDMLDFYGFDITPCLATGCTEEMLSNDRCDEPCNHAVCDYDITLCFKFFDMHGCKQTTFHSFPILLRMCPGLS